MDAFFTIALHHQRAANAVTKCWSYGTNSSFCISGPEDEHVAPKVLIADGCLINEKNQLLVVVEVAYSQTVPQVLKKVEENWLKSPNILAVIVIRMEESPGYFGPAADKVPAEPFLLQTEWLDREWPLDDEIAYDGHTWYARLYARFIIFVKRVNEPRDDNTRVCSCFSFTCLAVF